MSGTHQVVILVGGYASTAVNFEEHLAEWGVEVREHIEFPPLRIPTGTTGVILLKSLCSHSLFHAAQTGAVKRGIPLIAVDHHWTQAEPLLRQSGLLDPHSPDDSESGDSGNDSTDRIRAVVRAESVSLTREIESLRSLLHQTEDLVLERDDRILDMSRLLEAFGLRLDHLEHREAPVPVMVFDPTKAQRAVSAVDLLDGEKDKALNRMLHGCAAFGERGEATRMAGRRTGVGKDSVKITRKIRDTAPEVFEAMRRGVVPTVAGGRALALLSPEDRKVALAGLPK